MAELTNPTPREFSFVFNQDVFEVTRDSSGDSSKGVRNFHDPRLKLENGRIHRSDGKKRWGWWWV
jgi:hypothetical protein